MKNKKCLVEYKHTNKKLETHNFKVSSKGWHTIIVDDIVYLENPEKDIWEFLKGKCKGEQLFTWEAMMRETKKRGKKVPTDKEFNELLKSKENLKNITFPGYRNTNDFFYPPVSRLNLWSSTPIGCSYVWGRRLDSSYSTIFRSVYGRGNGFSVRCLKR